MVVWFGRFVRSWTDCEDGGAIRRSTASLTLRFYRLQVRWHVYNLRDFLSAAKRSASSDRLRPVKETETCWKKASRLAVRLQAAPLASTARRSFRRTKEPFVLLERRTSRADETLYVSYEDQQPGAVSSWSRICCSNTFKEQLGDTKDSLLIQDANNKLLRLMII